MREWFQGTRPWSLIAIRINFLSLSGLSWETGYGNNVQGLPQRVLDEEIPDLEMLSQALNFLLSKVRF